jgi:LIVCS family branched-chain amino acid:cation transporter
MTRLKGFDLLALGFMTFALFLGAGNIIFPPSAGMAAGDHLGLAAMGFLLTGVGLPLLTVVALARVGGGMPALTKPIGKVAGTALAVAVYLVIGPMFATPRTAVASFEIGVSPFSGSSWWALLAYTLVFFSVVLTLVLNPGRLIDNVGKIITPMLMVALILLGAAGLFFPAGDIGAASGDYVVQPMVKGFLEGYLTMDALGALVFGVVISTAVRDRGVSDPGLVTRYSIIAVLIAAFALAMVYLSLFYLGASSQELGAGASNGGQILTRYVQHTFGTPGMLLLSVVIVLACLTTAVGLMTACGEYFSELLGKPYPVVATAFVVVSCLVANVGLTQLIHFSIPVLMGLYPLAIALIVLSLLDRFWVSAPRVMIPVMLVTLVFAIADAFSAAGIATWVAWGLENLETGGGAWELLSALQQSVGGFFRSLPLATLEMGWVIPALITLGLAVIHDRLAPAPSAA